MRESELSFGSLLSGKKVKMFGRFPCAARAFFFMSKNANKQTSKQTNKQDNSTIVDANVHDVCACHSLTIT
jgi:hypothetical protein